MGVMLLFPFFYFQGNNKYKIEINDLEVVVDVVVNEIFEHFDHLTKSTMKFGISEIFNFSKLYK